MVKVGNNSKLSPYEGDNDDKCFSLCTSLENFELPSTTPSPIVIQQNLKDLSSDTCNVSPSSAKLAVVSSTPLINEYEPQEKRKGEEEDSITTNNTMKGESTEYSTTTTTTTTAAATAAAAAATSSSLTTNTTSNSPNLQQKYLKLTAPPSKGPTKVIKTYPQFKTLMEEVFGINIRPINHSQINNFFSKEFAIPGGSNTKIYRMESWTLLCNMITDFKFDKKSKYFLGILGIVEGGEKGLIKMLLWDIEMKGQMKLRRVVFGG